MSFDVRNRDQKRLDFEAVKLLVASMEDVLNWSYGEVTKAETINYRTQKPEKDGLFCERIFGPVKDINPNDAKFKGIRSREMAVDKNGEVVTRSIVRRERMGHILLAAPVAHIWFLKGLPSAISLITDMTVKSLEKIVYFAAYVILSVDDEAKEALLAQLEQEIEADKAKLNQKYEELMAEDSADVKALAANRSKELDDLTEQYLANKATLDSLNKFALISETDYRDLPQEYADIITVGMGGEALKSILDQTDLEEVIAELTKEVEDAKGARRKKIMKRLKVLEGMHQAGIEPSSMCVIALPVIPPDLRPMVQLTGGRFATSDINDLYRRVINRNNRLKKLIALNAPEVIQRNERRMLQEAVDALIDNSASRNGRPVTSTGGRRKLKSLSDSLKGKQGRFRQNLLGKRVDYSGRSVIVSGPELSMDQCGIPKTMAMELFKPYVMGWLIQRDYAHNIRTASRMIEAGEDIIWDALEDSIENKYVLLNRAPTLHRLSVQAFKPVLVSGKAIMLHPLVCQGFNADFDGDQMAVHLPLSDESQKEARTIMAANKNLLKPADGSPILHITQDIVLGCYYLTYQKPGTEDAKPVKLSGISEAEFAYEDGVITLQSNIEVSVKGNRTVTTYGRLLFNEILPEDFLYQNQPMTNKALSKVMSKIFDKYGVDVTAEVADKLKDLGFKYATIAGLSAGMDDFADVDGLSGMLAKGEDEAETITKDYEDGLITDEERRRLTINAWREIDTEVLDKFKAQFEKTDSSMAIAVVSGARGSVGQFKNVSGMKGVVVDALGREIELPIRSNYKKGLSPIEYYIDTRASRKGLVDTALKTADAGYLTRKMVDVAQDIFTVEDESEDHGYLITREESEAINRGFGERLQGRYAAEDILVSNDVLVPKSELISKEAAAAIESSDIQQVRIMSVLTCSNLRGVSTKSYGVDLATGQLIKPNQPVGVIAAQSIGEYGTQLTLNTKHKAGSAIEDDVTQGLPRIEELLEARNPKGQAIVTEVGGIVSIIENNDDFTVTVTPDGARVEEFDLGDRVLYISEGSDVISGDTIAANTDGSHPIVAPFAAKLSLNQEANKVILTSAHNTSLKYSVPKFKQLVVSEGDKIYSGDRLTIGSLNLHDLMKFKGVEAAQRYIINEMLAMYAAQGVDIADKHVEIIVRQMFSRVQIDESGDSLLVTGDIVSKATVVEENIRLILEGKKPIQYTQLLLGIAKVSTASDSFLSAASFQDTNRVLIGAATSGRVDNLYGLKENVIIGRKIPVGTGVEDEQEAPTEEELEVIV
jgi:DNA-directed RNA polymerase subunit beta'